MTSIHYAHYKDFVKRLQENPGIRFRDYCRQNGISYHGFYKWLQRNHISLKRLYKAYGATDTIELPIPSDKEPPFREVRPMPASSEPTPFDSDIRSMRMALPGGIAVEVGSCSASVALSLLRECLAFGAGKEVAYV